MRTIYIDNEFRCYTENKKGRTAIETIIFDGKCDKFIEGYRFIPAGESWTRDDGVVFQGEMICPATDFRILDAAQRNSERTALEYIGLTGEKSPLEQAEEMREAINTVIESLDDETAKGMSTLFLTWSGDGISYKIGDRAAYQNMLFRCLQAHTSQQDWTPDTAPSLWAAISDPADEWPLWIQPTGSHNAYAVGANVMYNSIRYISKIDFNTTQPGTDERWWEKQA